MEYLTRLYKQASTTPRFNFHHSCWKIQLVHLFFADDLIVFSLADYYSVHILSHAFEQFSRATGLTANRDKSRIAMGGCIDEVRRLLIHLTGYQEGGLSFKYLGMPITSNKMSKFDCQILVEKITQRVKTWATRSLSYAGRITLINSVL